MTTALDSRWALLSASDIQIPPRSRLLCVTPVGLGTEAVESLTSYTSRVARAHLLSVASLFGWEIAPEINRTFLRNSERRSDPSALLTISFRALVHAINGTGVTATDFASAMEKLTLRSDLTKLTLAAWRNVIPFTGLLKRVRSWCPACCAKPKTGEQVYEKLIWNLSAVTICTLHNEHLQTACAVCKRPQPLLASRTVPGHCCWCTNILVKDRTTPKASRRELLRQIWIADEIAQVIRLGQTIESPSRSLIARSVDRCIRKTLLAESAFARALHSPQSSLNDWRKGRALPRLDAVLRICSVSNTHVADFLLGEISQSCSGRSVQPGRPRKFAQPRRSRPWTIDEAKRAEQILAEAKTRKPPVPLAVIAKLIGRPSASLYYKFHQSCLDVASRYRTFQAQRKRRLLSYAFNNLAVIVERDCSANIRNIAASLQCSETMLKSQRPELIKRLAIERRKRQKIRWRLFATEIRKSLRSKTPLSLGQIAKNLGCSPATLYNRVPQLCRLLSRHSKEQKANRSHRRKEQFARAVRNEALAAYANNIYPSVKTISSRFSKPKSLRSSSIALQALREARLELGL